MNKRIRKKKHTIFYSTDKRLVKKYQDAEVLPRSIADSLFSVESLNIGDRLKPDNKYLTKLYYVEKLYRCMVNFRNPPRRGYPKIDITQTKYKYKLTPFYLFEE